MYDKSYDDSHFSPILLILFTFVVQASYKVGTRRTKVSAVGKMTNRMISTEDIPPTWLNNAFLGKVLRSSENDHSIMVMSSEIKRATAPGDNYTSDMYRAVLQITRKGKNEERSIIIKATKFGMTGEVAKIFDKPDLFNQEIDTFTLIHPAMYNLLNEASIGPYQPFGAKYLYSEKGQVAITIVLEDLKRQGFTLAKATNGLDYNHCLLVIRSIARYHATSVVLLHKNPDCVKPFLQNLFYDEDSKAVIVRFGKNVEICAKEVDSWPDYKPRFSTKIHELSEKCIDVWLSSLKRENSGFKVLTHGDLWMNNMMFRYSDDTGDVMDVRFVDFQLSHWTTPAVDLHYFLYSSASIDVLEKVDILTDEYHTTLCKTLNQLGYESLQPTLEQFNEELDKRGVFAVFCALAMRSLVLLDRTDIPDMNEFFQKQDTIKLSEEFKISLRKLLPIFEERGWI